MLVKRIDVQQKHIDCGEPDSATSCPVAWAVAEAFGFDPASLDCEVYVEGSDIQVDTPGLARRGIISQQVSDFVNRFDDRLDVAPFSFDFEYEENVLISDD
jgi:hypothetical protein